MFEAQHGTNKQPPELHVKLFGVGGTSSLWPRAELNRLSAPPPRLPSEHVIRCHTTGTPGRLFFHKVGTRTARETSQAAAQAGGGRAVALLIICQFPY